MAPIPGALIGIPVAAAAALAGATILQQAPPVTITPPVISTPEGSRAVEQTQAGSRPPAAIVASFDGLGEGFEGPQGRATLRDPSDNSLAVGRDHIVQTVNSRMAIFTKQGKKFDTTGTVLYGPVNTNNVFRGFGGQCEALNNGDAVVRYDQLADRWLIVMPLFQPPVSEPSSPQRDGARQAPAVARRRPTRRKVPTRCATRSAAAPIR